jgi:hypothetical protein
VAGQQAFAHEEASSGSGVSKGAEVYEGDQGHTGRVIANVWAIPWTSAHAMIRVSPITLHKLLQLLNYGYASAFLLTNGFGIFILATVERRKISVLSTLSRFRQEYPVPTIKFEPIPALGEAPRCIGFFCASGFL